MTLAVKTVNLGKKFIISHEKEAIISRLFSGILSKKKSEEFWALQDIDIELHQSECLGIIGRNGAGKSTLLNILAGVTFPTKGSVETNGKVSAILSLGAGFQYDLTGEENIYINAAMFGLKSKEIKQRFKRIVEFSELEDFIDAPIKTYSTGMCMRLGFAVAINVDFDILLIDEILTVGDLSFQEKCLNKLKEFKQKGKSLIMVSQSLDLLNALSDSVVVLDKGRIILRRNISRELNGKIFVKNNEWGARMGSYETQITRVRFFNSRAEETSLFYSGEKVKVIVDYIVHKEIKEPHFGVAVFREDGLYCYGPNTKFDHIEIKELKKGKGEFSIIYKKLNLPSGKYRLSVAIWEKEEKFAYDNHYAYYKFEVVSDKEDHGILYLDHEWELKLP